MLKNEGDKLRKVIVCTPGNEYFSIYNLKTHNIAEIADRARTIEQHRRLKEIMTEFGADVIDIKELSGHPNSVFTRDTAICCPGGYIRLRMGLNTRRGEEDWIARRLKNLGEPSAGMITEPGTVEGGDVILAGKTAFIGISSRTNREGARQVSGILEDMDFETRTVRVPAPYLHIGGAMSMVTPNRILYCPGVFPKGFFDGFDTIEVPAGDFVSGNVICLGENLVIAHSGNIITNEILRKAGVHVRSTDLSEFIKGAGGPSCLILPLERD